jgi:hypothetical protein
VRRAGRRIQKSHRCDQCREDEGVHGWYPW